jgi:hypothetical protein
MMFGLRVCLLSVPNADHMSSAKSRTDHVKPTDQQGLDCPSFSGVLSGVNQAFGVYLFFNFRYGSNITVSNILVTVLGA